MTKGFFSACKVQSHRRVGDTSHCGVCGLCKAKVEKGRSLITPKMPPFGKGRKSILTVAEAPGQNEDARGRPLVGKAGQLYRNVLDEFDISLDDDCTSTNAVICRRIGNKRPEDYMIEACKPNLMKTIRECNPKVILLLGDVACKSLLKELYGDDVGPISRWSGYCIPCREPNAWIVPTYHPSYVRRGYNREYGPGSKVNKLLEVIFRRDIKQAVDKAKESRPTVINYKEQVEIIVRPSQAAKAVRAMLKEEKAKKKKGAVVFDYEANCLKPEGDGVELVSCSVCWRGRRTVSFPWQGEAIEAVDEMTRSPVLKIGANLKFEERWTMAKLGHPVTNWYWDIVVAAHVLNNAPGVTSLAFQAFVLLGQGDYVSHIKPYFEQKKGSRFNRILELNLNDLLLKGGLDSCLEYWVAMKQIELLRERQNGYL